MEVKAQNQLCSYLLIRDPEHLVLFSFLSCLSRLSKMRIRASQGLFHPTPIPLCTIRTSRPQPQSPRYFGGPLGNGPFNRHQWTINGLVHLVGLKSKV